jgi:hypothetical protein
MAVLKTLQVSLDFYQPCENRPLQRAAAFSKVPRNCPLKPAFTQRYRTIRRLDMGRGLLLWLIGIPLPIILLIWFFGGLS